MHLKRSRTDPGFDVVVLGAGISALHIVLSFYEEYGAVSTVVSRSRSALIDRTPLARAIPLGETATDSDVRSALADLAAQRPAGRPAILLCATDSFVRFVDRHRAELGSDYLFALPPSEVLRTVLDKVEFMRLCERAGLQVPESVVVDFSRAREPGWEGDAPLPWAYPCVARPAARSDYERVSFPGKSAVYLVQSEHQHRRLVRSLRTAGYTGRVLFQELIPGDDTAHRTISAYRARNGEITLLGAAQVLLAEHTPEKPGRGLAHLTGPHAEIRDAVAGVLDEAEYVGCASVDVKIDARDDSPRVIGFTPRLGRSSFALVAAGANPARHLVADLVERSPAEPVVLERAVLSSIVPLPVLLRYLRDPALRARVRAAAQESCASPLRVRVGSRRSRALSRVLALTLSTRLMRVYPRPTDTGFRSTRAGRPRRARQPQKGTGHDARNTPR